MVQRVGKKSGIRPFYNFFLFIINYPYIISHISVTFSKGFLANKIDDFENHPFILSLDGKMGRCQKME